MRFLMLLLLASLSLAQAPDLRSVGTMSELMLDIVYPTSDRIFYVERDSTKTEKDWIELRQSALTLAETANLLMAPNRAKDSDRWMKDAKLLLEVGSKAFLAAKARDVPALAALNAELYESCQSCHEHYRKGYRRRPV